MGSCSPISPVEQTTTSLAEMPSSSAVFSAVRVRVLEALRTGAGVGAAGIEDDGVHPAVA